MFISMKYSILLSNVGGRYLSLKLISKNMVLLGTALLCLPLFLAYDRHIIPYLKPVGPDELENSLFARFLKESHAIYYVISPVGAGASCCINTLIFVQQITGYMIIPTKRLLDYKQSQISSLGQAVLPNKSQKNFGYAEC